MTPELLVFGEQVYKLSKFSWFPLSAAPSRAVWAAGTFHSIIRMPKASEGIDLCIYLITSKNPPQPRHSIFRSRQISVCRGHPSGGGDKSHRLIFGVKFYYEPAPAAPSGWHNSPRSYGCRKRQRVLGVSTYFRTRPSAPTPPLHLQYFPPPDATTAVFPFSGTFCNRAGFPARL